MNKKILIQIAVVAIVLLFILEFFFLGGGGTQLFSMFSPGQTEGVEVTGETTFNGTIRTYDPFVAFSTATDQSILNEVKAREEVIDVIIDGQYYVAQTETRDDVYPLASYLRSKGVDCFSKANVVFPPTIEVQLAGGNMIEAYPPESVVGIYVEPVLDAGNEVTVYMEVILVNDMITGYASASLLMETTSILVDATVEQLNYKMYSYSIPWESRNSLGDLEQYGEVEYNKIDSMVFNPPLDAGQIVLKKQFSYIEYIDSGSAQVQSDFDNVSQLEKNFQDVSFTLPPSTLAIKTNETPDIPFNATVTYNYNIMFLENSTDYEFDSLSFDIELNEEQEINNTIELNVSVVVAGTKIVSVGEITPS